MRILVTGAGGLLGSLLVERGLARGHEMVGAARKDLDVTDHAAVRQRVLDVAADWIVHCAAWTAVDRAEAEPEGAFRVNEAGTWNVAAEAAACGTPMVYVSSDYVFDGRRRTPYRVGDRPSPISAYGRSKLAGERVTRRAYAQRAAWGLQPLIVRTGWLYGAGGRGFVRTIVDRAASGMALRVVDDQTGRPTWARNVADVVLELTSAGAGGTWHVADRGTATWLDLAREACRLEGADAEPAGVSTAEWGAAAARPPYSVLALDRTEAELGRPMQDWKDALAECLAEEGGDDRTAPRVATAPPEAT